MRRTATQLTRHWRPKRRWRLVPMAPPPLHLDADASLRALHSPLVARGHDVTRTPNAWMKRDASVTEQLLGAPAQGRVFFYVQCTRFSEACAALSRAWRGDPGSPTALDAIAINCS